MHGAISENSQNQQNHRNQQNQSVHVLDTD